ncbi:hypothetical protein C7M84_005293 [Penaeus vannamei]|uniref:Uncharacterized protein n=1 Tax=Penaeus vannamei TaxID=6689 RepID=A0A423TI29_PENVA|nr:hypothetical protein C7M84_005293 [Penaeus vannamei]
MCVCVCADESMESSRPRITVKRVWVKVAPDITLGLLFTFKIPGHAPQEAFYSESFMRDYGSFRTLEDNEDNDDADSFTRAQGRLHHQNPTLPLLTSFPPPLLLLLFSLSSFAFLLFFLPFLHYSYFSFPFPLTLLSLSPPPPLLPLHLTLLSPNFHLGLSTSLSLSPLPLSPLISNHPSRLFHSLPLSVFLLLFSFPLHSLPSFLFSPILLFPLSFRLLSFLPCIFSFLLSPSHSYSSFYFPFISFFPFSSLRSSFCLLPLTHSHSSSLSPRRVTIPRFPNELITHLHIPLSPGLFEFRTFPPPLSSLPTPLPLSSHSPLSPLPPPSPPLSPLSPLPSPPPPPSLSLLHLTFFSAIIHFLALPYPTPFLPLPRDAAPPQTCFLGNKPLTFPSPMAS